MRLVRARLTIHSSGANRNTWILSSYAHPPTLVGWQERRSNACIESRICQLLLKTRGSSEAVLEQEDTSKVVQCFSYSIASFVPLVFNTQPTKSGLYTFPLRRQIACQPVSGRNYSIFIYFCSRRSYVYATNYYGDRSVVPNIATIICDSTERL